MSNERSGEFRAKTVEMAIAAGLAALRLTREEVEVEIVRPGSRGVLGIGAEDALVRLTAGRSGRSDEPIRSEPRPVQPARVEPPAAPRPPAPAPRVEPAAPVPQSAPRPPVRAESRSEGRSVERARPAGRGDAPRSRPPVSSDRGEPSGDVGQIGREILTGLLQRMDLHATVELTQQSDAEVDESGERSQVLNIVGDNDDLSVLIGRQNETLSAVEYLSRLMTNQQSHSRSDLVIDVNGYRAKRAESLRRLALRSAEQVAQSGRTLSLEPMSPADRRIVHLALREHPQVYTQSVGEGDRRKVTIVLKKE